MSNGPARPIATPGCYQLPEDAHLALEQTRDRLRLLACLAAPRSPHDDLPEAAFLLKPAALAHCFQELADRLDRILQQVHWPGASPSA
ncbi:XAC0095 family protein [Luteimonas salinilitoris]|uniref:XAC0095 family protein n=1 Tax=Luteimonas salinilitoris TaxID=3237697 RepID=A0ABV4HS26_9GAMM